MEGIYVYVRYPNGDFTVHFFDGKIVGLKYQIHAKTGIPLEAQKLYYQSRLLNKRNISSIPNGCSLELSLGLRGGTGHCDICYEDGAFTCSDCQGKVYCNDCCKSAHKHPSRSSHNPVPIGSNFNISSDLVEPPSNMSQSASLPEPMTSTGHTDRLSDDPWDDDDITDSPNTSQAFMEASMIMTLAEKFNLTRFRKYQKEVITALLAGQDCLVVQPTGSGKSMCFQFPAVHQNKISVVITPTISLMQDDVKNCETYGIKAAYLGSAQLDLQLEEHVLSGDSDVSIVLVTPEWIAKADKKAKIRLIDENRVCLIALDEAHLFHYWQEFRPAYKTLESLKHDFPSTPLLCLTAIAPPAVEESIHYLLINPTISKGSIDRPNIMLACEEIPSSIRRKDLSYFASRVSEMLQSDECAIVYTDFIDDVGPIMSELSNYGIELMLDLS